MANLRQIEEVEFHQFIAQQALIHMQRRFSEQGLKALSNSGETSIAVERETGTLVLNFTAQCLAGRTDDLIERQIFRYPNGAWQMFKDRHLPYWFQRWFPVRHTEREIETCRSTYFICPHLVTDPTHKHVAFMATGTPEAGYFRNS